MAERSGLVPETLGARLGAWLGGRVEGTLHEPFSDGEGDSAGEGVIDSGAEPAPFAIAVAWGGRTRRSRSLTVGPGCFGWAWASGGGRGIEWCSALCGRWGGGETA